jgi:hypothetical protein
MDFLKFWKENYFENCTYRGFKSTFGLEPETISYIYSKSDKNVFSFSNLR